MQMRKIEAQRGEVTSVSSYPHPHPPTPQLPGFILAPGLHPVRQRVHIRLKGQGEHTPETEGCRDGVAGGGGEADERTRTRTWTLRE